MNSDVICLNLPQTKCYLLKSKEGYLLIDTGYIHDLEIFNHELQKNSIDINEINYLFLTHHHDDHSGLTNYIVEKNIKTRVIMHKLAVEALLTGKNESMIKSGSERGGIPTKRILLILIIRKLLKSNWTATFPSFKVRDKDIIVYGDDNSLLRELGINGKILYTPGHSKDSISILTDDGNLFSGDAAMNMLLTQLGGCKFTTISILDLEEYYESWSKIISSGAKNIFPSHGKPFPVEKLKKYIWKIKKLVPKPDLLMNLFKKQSAI